MEAVSLKQVFERRKPIATSVGTCSTVCVRILFMAEGGSESWCVSATGTRFGVERLWEAKNVEKDKNVWLRGERG